MVYFTYYGKMVFRVNVGNSDWFDQYLEEFAVPVPICSLRQYRLQRGDSL
jgi:hypothetical protein